MPSILQPGTTQGLHGKVHSTKKEGDPMSIEEASLARAQSH